MLKFYNEVMKYIPKTTECNMYVFAYLLCTSLQYKTPGTGHPYSTLWQIQVIMLIIVSDT